MWGTDIYTDDSALACAAVHAGVVLAGQTKVVTVKIVAGQSSYQGSVRNGVTSSSYGTWPGSYSFVGKYVFMCALFSTVIHVYDIHVFQCLSNTVVYDQSNICGVNYWNCSQMFYCT